MSLEKFGNRAEDRGQEPPIVTLARVDENVKFLKSGAEAVRIQLYEHEKKDNEYQQKTDAKINSVNKSIWYAGGVVSVIIFVINWFHK